MSKLQRAEQSEECPVRIRDYYTRATPTISFEFFPPKSAEAEATLFRDTVPGLKALSPSFISVTFGAGGSTRGSTFRIVKRLRDEYGIESMPHLTCVGSTREQQAGLMDEIHSLGFENVLALRGDPPKGQTTFEPVEGGFRYAVDLIRFIKGRHPDFCVGAACYPEGHIEAAQKHRDWDIALAKVESGADFLLSQLFYDWSDFLDMWDYLRHKRNVKIPVVPGILPFLGTEQIKRFTGMCGAKLVQPLRLRLEKYAHDDEAVRQIGVEICTEVCERLLRAGVAGIHFYCLNRVASCREVVHNLGLGGK
jgi:methylenetetrahydrofolate reductase (NADPH)